MDEPLHFHGLQQVDEARVLRGDPNLLTLLDIVL